MKKKEKTRGVTNKMVGIGSLIQNAKRKLHPLSLLRSVEDMAAVVLWFGATFDCSLLGYLAPYTQIAIRPFRRP